MSELLPDPLGDQLKCIQSLNILLPSIAHIISSYIGYIESTLDCDIRTNCITCKAFSCGSKLNRESLFSSKMPNENCLVITPPQHSQCKYILESFTFRLGSFPPLNAFIWKDGTFSAKIELIDKSNPSISTGQVLYEQHDIKGGAEHNILVKMQINLELQCGESYLFYLEQSDEQIVESDIHTAISKDNHRGNTLLIGKRSLVEDAQWIRHAPPYNIEYPKWTKITEVVFYHK